MVPAHLRMVNTIVCVQTAGLVLTAVFALRWSAMMKLTMMKVRVRDIDISDTTPKSITEHVTLFFNHTVIILLRRTVTLELAYD